MIEDCFGNAERICTDEDWKAYAGHIGRNSIYDGEWQNDMLEDEPLQVEVLEDDTSLLTERSGPPIRKVEEFLPVSERFHRDGYLLLDFGESITGWVEFTGRLERGQRIRLQYGELLQNQDFYRKTCGRRKRNLFMFPMEKKRRYARILPIMVFVMSG